MPSLTRLRARRAERCFGNCFRLALFFASVLAIVLLAGQIPACASAQVADSSVAFRRAGHLRRGINLSGWLAENGNTAIDALKANTTPADLDHIHALGFDFVRIPVDPSVFACDEPGTGSNTSPGSSCERVQLLDTMIAKALSLDLAVIVDLHPGYPYLHELATDDQAVERFLQLWGRIAEHYTGREGGKDHAGPEHAVGHADPERVFLEVMNESGMNDHLRWASILTQAVAVIRRHAPDSTIVIQGAGSSDIWDLVQLPAIADSNLIYNFHYYEPHIFTHQGANWALDWWKDLRDIPFPSDPASVDRAMREQQNELVQWRILQYGEDRWNAARIASDVAFAMSWARTRKVPLICNEFGVYRAFTRPEDRERWLTATRTALEKNSVGWAMWDYQGGFGIVNKPGGNLQDDQSVIRALGLRK